MDICIRSVLNQDYSNYEVVFVDNASSDGSLEYARDHYPDLTFVANGQNLGYAAGIDSGAKIARGTYISPLNIDTEADPNWLSQMVNFLQNNSVAGAVTPKILLFDARSKINAMGHNLHFSGLSFCRRLGKDDKKYQVPERVSGISGCSYMLKKDLWNQISDLVVDSFMANDDVIISWILTLMDYRLYVVPQSVLYHKYKLFMNADKFYRLETGRLELLFSSLHLYTLVLMSPCLIFIELLQLIYCLIKGQKYIRSKIEAYSYIWHSKQVIQNKKNKIRSIRKISDCSLWSRLSWNLDWKQLLNISR